MDLDPRVLHADNHLLVVDKPGGLPVVPDASRDESLLDAARAWIRRVKGKPGEAWVGVVHRLDRPVSGVLVLARTSKAAARLSAQFAAGTVEKLYLGVSRERPRGDEGLLVQWLVKDAARNTARPVAEGEPGARRAETRWRVLAEAGRGTGRRVLLALVPATGRPHQLRVAAASLGAPLVGDLRYGAREALPDRSVALHAARLVLAHPTRGETLEFRARPPRLPIWAFADLERRIESEGRPGS